MLRSLQSKISQHPVVQRLLRDPFFRLLAMRTTTAGWDIIYALFNLILALVYRTFWFVSISAYYVILGALGVFALRYGTKRGEQAVPTILKLCGYGMCALALAASGVVCMCIAETRNSSYHIVVMIALAAYAFFLATTSIVNAVRGRKSNGLQRIFHKLTLASTIGSILTLEFSMLGTFGDPTDAFSFVMEVASGAFAVVLLLLLGRSFLSQKQ